MEQGLSEEDAGNLATSDLKDLGKLKQESTIDTGAMKNADPRYKTPTF